MLHRERRRPDYESRGSTLRGFREADAGTLARRRGEALARAPARVRRLLRPRALCGEGVIVVGFGGVTAILWELGEYFAFIRNSPELATAYTDMLGDLSLGLSGSTLAAAIAVVALSKPRRAKA